MTWLADELRWETRALVVTQVQQLAEQGRLCLVTACRSRSEIGVDVHSQDLVTQPPTPK